MNCRSAESLFSPFLDDALSQSERRSFEAHLLRCRRCSVSLREVKSTLALVSNVAKATAVETSPHFEADVMARIRSGEAMRPSVIEWLQGLLTPERLRPVFVVGAAACAVFIAVTVFNRNTSKPSAPGNPSLASSAAPAAGTTGAPSTPDAASLGAGAVTPSDAATTVASAAPARRTARSSKANGIVEIADRVVPSKGSEVDSALPNPNAAFSDEYVTDQFILRRDQVQTNPQEPSVVPVTDQGSDDVYIEF